MLPARELEAMGHRIGIYPSQTHRAAIAAAKKVLAVLKRDGDTAAMESRARHFHGPRGGGEFEALARAGDEIPERRLMRVTLCENMRAVPYVPFYLALAGGYWESEGLDIRHVVSPSTARTATALLDGSGRCLVGRADARDDASRRRSEMPARVLRAGRGARPVPPRRAHAQEPLSAGTTSSACASRRRATCRRRG